MGGYIYQWINVWSSCEQKILGQFGPTAGTQTKSRICVEPKFGGNSCTGSSSENRNCNIPLPFAVTFNLNNCSKSCGGGHTEQNKRTLMRDREQVQIFGGASCSGLATDQLELVTLLIVQLMVVME